MLVFRPSLLYYNSENDLLYRRLNEHTQLDYYALWHRTEGYKPNKKLIFFLLVLTVGSTGRHFLHVIDFELYNLWFENYDNEISDLENFTEISKILVPIIFFKKIRNVINLNSNTYNIFIKVYFYLFKDLLQNTKFLIKKYKILWHSFVKKSFRKALIRSPHVDKDSKESFFLKSYNIQLKYTLQFEFLIKFFLKHLQYSVYSKQFLSNIYIFLKYNNSLKFYFVDKKYNKFFKNFLLINLLVTHSQCILF